MKGVCMDKRFYKCFLVLTFIPYLYGMKLSDNTLEHNLLTIPLSVVHYCIQPYLSHQEIGRFQQVAQWSPRLFDSAYGCHHVGNKFCNTPACSVLENNFYACTKVLAYFSERQKKAQKKKEDRDAEIFERLFQHLWFLHGSIRIKDARLKKRFYLDHQMRLYRKNYSRSEAIARWIFEYSIKTVKSDHGVICKRMLSGGQCNIFDIASVYTPEEMICVRKGIGLLFDYACNNQDFEFVQMLCGSSVDSRSLPYIMGMSSEGFALQLIERKFLLPDVADACGRQPLHFAARYGFRNFITSLLLHGAYINSRDDEGRTALHYGVKYVSVFSVQELLKCPDASVLLKDKSGSSVLDLAKRKRMFKCSNPSKQYDRVYIKNLIQAHVASTTSNATDSSHKLRYQEL